MSQIVITRLQDGGFRVIEMGMGETQREHDIKPEISADMAAKYIADLMRNLVAVPK
jgi:hypothetical protein